MSEHIEIARWGRDHWTTFAYLAHCVVNREGLPDHEKMRTDPDRRPHLVGFAQRRFFEPKKYPTRVKDGEVADHDDWSCAEDMAAEGLVEEIGTGLNPRYRFTEAGWEVWRQFERHIADNSRNWSATFAPDLSFRVAVAS